LRDNLDPLARGRNPLGEVQPLHAHLTSVAQLCSSMCNKFGFPAVGYLLGYWHDIGKVHPDWQDYLRRSEKAKEQGNDVKGPHPNHSPTGACRAESIGPLGMVISAHHSRLSSKAIYKNNLQKYMNNPIYMDGLNIWRDLESTGLESREASATKELAKIKVKPELEFLIRFLLSALIDADRLDSEAHAEPEKGTLREIQPDLSVLRGNLFSELDRLAKVTSDSAVNRVRREILRNCVDYADSEPGIFRLTAPTGSGKTLASLAFALNHAIRHNLDRIIVAIPYTSIIDQTASNFRRILGAGVVLEHHSAVRSLDELSDIEEDRFRLGAENWDFPLIVTTTNQLFESLFSDRASRVRKLHNIARSVIIIDEVQTLPVGLLEPTLDAVRLITGYFGSTVVLSTATQPAIEGNKHFEGLNNVIEIVSEPEQHFDQLRRVTYEWPDGKESWAEIAQKILEIEQVLTIVNTKGDAIKLIDELHSADIYHLSTNLCGSHRREKLDEIRDLLASGKPCRVVSTQVVEAGVDLDFPVVMRAIGPLDRIVQAAGRCNREGKLKGKGRVIIFDPEDGKCPPGSYRTGTSEAGVLINEGNLDPDNPAVFERYFGRLYQGCNTDKHNIQEKRDHFNYPEVAKLYRFIPDETHPVVITSWHADIVGAILDKITRKLKAGILPGRADFRALQPYIVNLPGYQYRSCSEWIDTETIPGISLWLGPYDPVRGLVTEYTRTEDTLW